jgi:membrane-associated PAP2 superfamily phosphatase
MSPAVPAHPQCHSPRAFYLLHLGIPVAGLLALLLLELTPIDSLVSGWFYDTKAGNFPLHYNAAFEIVTHLWAKYLVVLAGCAVVVAYLLTFVLSSLRHQRRLLLFLSLALTLAPAAVSALKAGSPRHCPYDLVEYGGFAARVELFDPAPPDQIPGHCFPSGHASAGFCLLAFYFAGLSLGKRRLALYGLWGGLTAGMLFGMARVAQGAHFLSHNLWSALVCWLIILALYVAIMNRPTPQSASAAIVDPA